MGRRSCLLPMRDPLSAIWRLRVKEMSMSGRAVIDGSLRPKPPLELDMLAISFVSVGIFVSKHPITEQHCKNLSCCEPSNCGVP